MDAETLEIENGAVFRVNFDALTAHSFETLLDVAELASARL